jgi:hypothetical protein
MQDRLVFLISAPRAGSTLLQRMLGSHSQIASFPEPHLITPLAHLGYFDLVDKAPYDHINAAEALKTFVAALPHGEADYFDAVRCYTDTLYGRMLNQLGRRYFLDKTPAYALVMPFLTRLYPFAHYVVLTRNPLAIASSYARSFFDGNWEAASAFNPVVNRYVPAIARTLRNPPVRLFHVRYEQLVREPAAELSKIFAFLGLRHESAAVEYGTRYVHPRTGRGDPVTVDKQTRPVEDFIDAWHGELSRDAHKRAHAIEIISALEDQDLRLLGFARAELLHTLASLAPRSTPKPAARKRWRNRHLLERRIMLALKKDIRRRPHGKWVERVRYYCNVLLRE